MTIVNLAIVAFVYTDISKLVNLIHHQLSVFFWSQWSSDNVCVGSLRSEDQIPLWTVVFVAAGTAAYGMALSAHPNCSA